MSNSSFFAAYRFRADERGMTGLETAVILIAFIVAAAVFAFAILSAGTFSTERGQDSVLAGVNEVQSTFEPRGQMVAIAGTTGMTGTVESLVFSLANVLKGNPVPLDSAGVGSQRVIIRYHDDSQRNPDLTWSVNWLVNDGDNLLENGELAEIIVANLDVQLASPLSTSTQFYLEVVPPWGNTLSLLRTTPPVLDPVNKLD